MTYSAKDDKDFIATALARFKLAIDAKALNVVSAIDDVRFAAANSDNQWQWPQQLLTVRQNDPNGARPCLTINVLPQHIRQVTNDQQQNRPAMKVLPVDDRGDVEVAKILNGMMRHIEANSDADVAYDTACDNQVTHGEGYFRILTDYCDEKSFEQDIKVGRIRNSFSVYMDPYIKHPAGADQRWCFITQKLPADEYKALYPNAEKIEWDTVQPGDNTLAWRDDDDVMIAEYFFFRAVDAKLYLWRTGEVTMDGDPLPEGIYAGEKPLKERTTQIQKVYWVKMNCQEVLDEREWPGKYIPIIRVVGNEYDVEGEIVTSGIVRNAKDSCRMYNYHSSLEVEFAGLGPKAPYVGAAEAVAGYEADWQSANVANVALLKYHAYDEQGRILQKPERQIPPQPAAAFIQAKMGAAEDIKRTTGQYDPSLGNNRHAQSGVALRAEASRTDMGTYHYQSNFAKALRQGTRICIDLIPKIYDTRRIARAVGIDGEIEDVVIDPKQVEPVRSVKDENGTEIARVYNPGIGRYDVVATVGPSFTTRRQEAAIALQELAQTAADPTAAAVLRYLVIKNSDFPGADEAAAIVKRMLPPEVLGEDPNAGQKLKQAEQIIEAYKEQIASAERAMDEMTAAHSEQKAMLERMKVEVSAYDAETKRMKETAVYMTPEELTALMRDQLPGLLSSMDLSPMPMPAAEPNRPTNEPQLMPQ